MFVNISGEGAKSESWSHFLSRIGPDTAMKFKSFSLSSFPVLLLIHLLYIFYFAINVFIIALVVSYIFIKFSKPTISSSVLSRS